MKLFAIGDLHLSFDENWEVLKKPMDIFGTGWKNHTQRLEEHWNEMVSEEDVVLIPGDISWGLKLEEAAPDLAWIHHLPGRKIITKGNHDLWWSSISKLNALYEDILFLQNKAEQVMPGVFVCGTRGWTCPGADDFDTHDMKIYEREVLRLRMSLDHAKNQGADEIIAMLHYPPTNDKHQRSEFTNLLREYGVKTCIYGHLHGKENFRRGITGFFDEVEYHLVSLDSIGAYPLRLK